MLTSPAPGRDYSFDDELESYEGWAKHNRHYWVQDYRGFLEFFFGQGFPEPHSTKQTEDCISFGLDTTGETLVRTMQSSAGLPTRGPWEGLGSRLRRPVVV